MQREDRDSKGKRLYLSEGSDRMQSKTPNFAFSVAVSDLTPLQTVYQVLHQWRAHLQHNSRQSVNGQRVNRLQVIEQQFCRHAYRLHVLHLQGQPACARHNDKLACCSSARGSSTSVGDDKHAKLHGLAHISYAHIERVHSTCCIRSNLSRGLTASPREQPSRRSIVPPNRSERSLSLSCATESL